MLKRLKRFVTVIGSSAVIFLVAMPVNAYRFDMTDERVFSHGDDINQNQVIVLPTVQPSGGWTLPTLTTTHALNRFHSVKLTQFDRRFLRLNNINLQKGSGAGIQGRETTSSGQTSDIDDTDVWGVTFESTFADTVIQPDAQNVTIRLTGTPVIPEGEHLGISRLYDTNFLFEGRSRLIFCDSAQGESVTQCGIDRLATLAQVQFEELIRLRVQLDASPTQAQLDALQAMIDTLNNRPTQAQLDMAQAMVTQLTNQLNARPTQMEVDDLSAQIALLEQQIRELGAEPVAAGGGGSSGAGALGAVALAGGAYYWWKKQNPNSTLSFMAMPTDTDAYVAEFNATPKENLHFNVRYSEGNLFADSDFVKPETNSTVMATVKWTW